LSKKGNDRENQKAEAFQLKQDMIWKSGPESTLTFVVRREIASQN